MTVAIAKLLEYDTAGDPITGLKWSHRTTAKIAAEIRQHYGIDISPNTVARLLHQMDYSLRVNQKKLATDYSADRNLQFDYISDARNRFQRGHLPLISVDSKKRELVGNFSNPGTRWDHSPRLVYDHDFRTDARGIAIPYGIYDPRANRGSIVVGVSHDTPAFAVHSIAHWWRWEGLRRYPRSRQLLILADTGGSNNCRYRTWKTELQTQLADPFRLTVTVAHYPTRYLKVESDRASPVLRNLQKLGRRAVGQLPENTQFHSHYHHQDRPFRLRLFGPTTLPN